MFKKTIHLILPWTYQPDVLYSEQFVLLQVTFDNTSNNTRRKWQHVI